MADNNSPLSLVSGLLGAGAGVVGNLFNADQNQAQRDWSEKMWRLNNEYNTPANQMKRLRQAGLNPHFALQGGQLGTGNSYSPPAMTTPHPYDFSPVSQAIQSSAELYQQQRYQDADIGLKNQQAENMRIRNDYEDRRQWLDLLKLENDKDLSDETRRKVAVERELLETDMATRSERNRVEIDRIKAESDRAIQEGRKVRLEGDWQNIVNQYEIPNRVKILRNLDAQYEEIMSAASRNDAEAANAAAAKALTDVNAETARKIQKHVVDKAFYEAKEVRYRGDTERYRAGNEAKRYYGGRFGYEAPRSGFTDKAKYNQSTKLPSR